MVSSKFSEDLTFGWGGDRTQPGQGMVRCKCKNNDEIAIERCVLQQSELCEDCLYYISKAILRNKKIVFAYHFSSRCDQAGHIRAKDSNMCAFCYIYDLLDNRQKAMSGKLVEQAFQEGNRKKSKNKTSKPCKKENIGATLKEELEKIRKKKQKEQRLMKRKQTSEVEQRRESEPAEQIEQDSLSKQDTMMLARLDSLEYKLKKNREVLDGYKERFEEIEKASSLVIADTDALRVENKNLHSLLDNYQSAETKYVEQLSYFKEENQQLRSELERWQDGLQDQLVSSFHLPQTDVDLDSPLGQWAVRSFLVLTFLAHCAAGSRLQKHISLPVDSEFLIKLVHDFEKFLEEGEADDARR